MMIKLRLYIVEGPGGQKPRIFGLFWGWSHFQPASIHPPYQTCRKVVFGRFTSTQQISIQNIDRKILFAKKIKISTGWMSTVQPLYLAINPQPPGYQANQDAPGYLLHYVKPHIKSLPNVFWSQDPKLWSRSQFSSPTLCKTEYLSSQRPVPPFLQGSCFWVFRRSA